MTFLRKAVVLFSIVSFASATCYWPTGNATYDRDLYEHQPCSNDTTSPLHTICCALNRTNPSGGDITNGRTNDVCLPNGVCENRVLNHGTMQVSYWRETCTSQNWKTGLCLDICSDDWTAGNLTTGAVMTPCDGTEHSLKWCCGVDTSCCNDDSKVKTLPYEFRGALPNTAVASTVPIATSTSTTTSTPTSSSTKAPDAGLTTGAKAGIGVGAGVGALALIGIGFLLARRSSKKREERANIAGDQPAEKVQYRHDQAGFPPSPYSQGGQSPYGQEQSPYGSSNSPYGQQYAYQQAPLSPQEVENRSRAELPYQSQFKPGVHYEMG